MDKKTEDAASKADVLGGKKIETYGAEAVDRAVAESAEVKTDSKVSDIEFKIAETENHFKRLAAEFDNYRKRVEKEKSEIKQYAESKLLLEIISINDVIEKALEMQKSPADENAKKGLQLILNEFQKVLKNHEVKKMESKGRKFDPKLHDATATTVNKDLADEIIVEEIQLGYFFKDSVLRPAMVVISKKEQEKKPE